MRWPLASSPDWPAFAQCWRRRAARAKSLWRLAILLVLVLASTQREAGASLIIQVDTVNIISDGSMTVSGYIEVYAILTGATTVSNLAGFDIGVTVQGPATYTGGAVQPTTIHPWVFQTSGATMTTLVNDPTSPVFDGLINSGGAALTTGEGLLSIPFTVPAGNLGSYAVTPTLTFLSDSSHPAQQILVDAAYPGEIIISPSAVPEPSSMVLGLMAASGGWFAFRRRHRGTLPAAENSAADESPKPA